MTSASTKQTPATRKIWIRPTVNAVRPAKQAETSMLHQAERLFHLSAS